MREKFQPLEISNHVELTYEHVQLFLTSNSFKFRPSQLKISYPKIVRIHRRYMDGARYSEIKIRKDGGISDGHHRFISLALLNVDANTVPAGEHITKEELLFRMEKYHIG